jgi:acetyltransferase-like isoleucine patch superfamily enzyme
MKSLLKQVAYVLATICVSPQLLSFAVRGSVMGKDRAIEGSTQLLSLIPGIAGQYLRRAFLAWALDGGCAKTAIVEFGTIFSQAGSRLDDHAYVGPRCHLGLVHLERDVLIGAGVHIPSGAHTHGTDPLRPIREQPGTRRMVRIGAGAWIGSNAVVMADVGRNTIVAAGAVVVQPLPDDVLAGGVPARVIRERVSVQHASA